MSLTSDLSLRLPIPVPTERVTDARATRPEDEVVFLFNELGDRLLRYLMCFGVSRHDGEEIVQESFLLLFQHLRLGKSRENLRGWVFKVARNLALKQVRKKRERERQMIPLEDALATSRSQTECDPEQQACMRQRQQILWSVVDALPERDQSCLFLRADGFRYREIADILGISLGSVASSMARSLGKLARVDGGAR